MVGGRAVIAVSSLGEAAARAGKRLAHGRSPQEWGSHAEGMAQDPWAEVRGQASRQAGPRDRHSRRSPHDARRPAGGGQDALGPAGGPPGAASQSRRDRRSIAKSIASQVSFRRASLRPGAALSQPPSLGHGSGSPGRGRIASAGRSEPRPPRLSLPGRTGRV